MLVYGVILCWCCLFRIRLNVVCVGWGEIKMVFFVVGGNSNGIALKGTFNFI